MKRTVVLFLVIVLFAGTARASDQWTSFLTNKFSTDYVRAIIPEGNTVWCATDGGIVKWDMLSETYTLEKSGTFFSAAIDWNGTKWFGCDTGLYALKDTTWTSFTKENTPSFNKGTGTVLFVTADNVNKRIICMLYYQYGQLEYRYTLLSFDGQKWEELLDYSDGYGGIFPFLVVDTVNSWDFWGCGSGPYFYLFKKEEQGYVVSATYSEDGFSQTNFIGIDPDDNLWMAVNDRKGNGAIGCYDRKRVTLFGSDVTGTIGRIQKVVIDRKGVKWFGSDGALVRYDDKTWSAYPFQKIDEYEHVIALAADESGDIWMGRGNSLSGAKGYGLWRFHPTQSGVEEAALPQAVKITGNFPNPFNPSTTISFSLPAPGKAELVVYSISGQRVRTLVSGPLSEGAHSVAWDGRDDSGKPVSSGLYLSRLTTGKQTATGKMLLMK